MTGESYALYREKSLLGRLAEEPDDPEGFVAGAQAAREAGGLLNRLFQARTRVLDGAMPGNRVGPYLSGLLIGTEFREAAPPPDRELTLIGGDALVARYGRAADRLGVTARPAPADLAALGAFRIATAAGLLPS